VSEENLSVKAGGNLAAIRDDTLKLFLLPCHFHRIFFCANTAGQLREHIDRRQHRGQTQHKSHIHDFHHTKKATNQVEPGPRPAASIKRLTMS
jgi:hypothetical protein